MSRERQMMEFNLADYLPKIAAVFNGINQEYEKLIRSYHLTYLDETRTDSYKREERAKTLNDVHSLVNDRVQAAKEIVAKVRQKYREPEPAPDLSVAEKTFNLLYWKEILPEADYSELRQLYSENKSDPVFIKLLHKEFKRREREKPKNLNITAQQELMAEISHEMEFPEFDKLERTLNFIAAVAREHFHSGIQKHIETNRKANLHIRNINEDLKRFPVKEGATFRPLFSLPKNVK